MFGSTKVVLVLSIQSFSDFSGFVVSFMWLFPQAARKSIPPIAQWDTATVWAIWHFGSKEEFAATSSQQGFSSELSSPLFFCASEKNLWILALTMAVAPKPVETLFVCLGQRCSGWVCVCACCGTVAVGGNSMSSNQLSWMTTADLSEQNRLGKHQSSFFWVKSIIFALIWGPFSNTPNCHVTAVMLVLYPVIFHCILLHPSDAQSFRCSTPNFSKKHYC